MIGLATVSLAMMLLWGVQRKTGNAGIVDVVWSASVGILGVFFALWPVESTWLRYLAAIMIGLWSVRLTVYLYLRVVGHPEEGRYAKLRLQWGDDANSKFFKFYQAQAAAAWCFALPVMVISRSSVTPANWMIGISVLLWALGIGGVALSDWQLAMFKADDRNQGRTCRTGLWNYSRHPNYFFEWLHWCAYIPLSLGSSYWWISVTVAVLLLLTVLFVTGIPPTEAQALASRGDDYRQYQQTTSAFVPWFPKNEN